MSWSHDSAGWRKYHASGGTLQPNEDAERYFEADIDPEAVEAQYIKDMVRIGNSRLHYAAKRYIGPLTLAEVVERENLSPAAEEMYAEVGAIFWLQIDPEGPRIWVGFENEPASDPYLGMCSKRKSIKALPLETHLQISGISAAAEPKPETEPEPEEPKPAPKKKIVRKRKKV